MSEEPRLTVQRPWSVAALVLAVGTIVLAVVVFITNFPRGLTVLACAALAVAAAWWGIQRRGAARSIALGLAGLLLVGAIALVVFEGAPLQDAIVLVAFAASLYAAREALKPRAQWPRAQPPERAVLFYNPKSGGGKAARFHLADEARKRGIEPVELQLGQDLETLVRDAVARGADGLAMAGGDGSQAIVAMVAADLGLPYACIPAGTRNHFALDLGVDRDDVVGALDAFVNGGERIVDLAEVNDRVFVNNVSLGLYADAVQRPGYREAKMHTILDTVPEVLGPDAAPPNLVWRGPAGEESAVAILISNNQYRLGRAIGSGTRPRLDRGELGITVLAPITTDRGSVSRKLGIQQWTAPEFEVDSAEPVPAGIDGEAVMLEAPVRFRIRPQALRVRIAPQHPGVSPSALAPDRPHEMLGRLVGLALHGAPTSPA
jgi:diacylglycerol kinase family enzyme